jgi:hypothetical protein
MKKLFSRKISHSGAEPMMRTRSRKKSNYSTISTHRRGEAKEGEAKQKRQKRKAGQNEFSSEEMEINFRISDAASANRSVFDVIRRRPLASLLCSLPPRSAFRKWWGLCKRRRGEAWPLPSWWAENALENGRKMQRKTSAGILIEQRRDSSRKPSQNSVSGKSTLAPTGTGRGEVFPRRGFHVLSPRSHQAEHIVCAFLSRRENHAEKGMKKWNKRRAEGNTRHPCIHYK